MTCVKPLFYKTVHCLMMDQWGPKHVAVCMLKHYCDSNEVCAFVVMLWPHYTSPVYNDTKYTVHGRRYRRYTRVRLYIHVYVVIRQNCLKHIAILILSPLLGSVLMLGEESKMGPMTWYGNAHSPKVMWRLPASAWIALHYDVTSGTSAEMASFPADWIPAGVRMNTCMEVLLTDAVSCWDHTASVVS